MQKGERKYRFDKNEPLGSAQFSAPLDLNRTKYTAPNKGHALFRLMHPQYLLIRRIQPDLVMDVMEMTKTTPCSDSIHTIHQTKWTKSFMLPKAEQETR